LFVCGGVIATSLEIKQTTNGLRAIAVRIEKENAMDDVASKTIRVCARREIILSSGAIATPQLLMLRYVGFNYDFLSSITCPQRHWPGGTSKGAWNHSHQRFAWRGCRPSMYELLNAVISAEFFNSLQQDHTSVSIQYAVRRQDTLHVAEDGNVLLMLKEFVRFLAKGSGLFLSPMPQLSIFALSRLIDEKGHNIPGPVDATDPNNVPDIEIMPSPYDCRDPMYKSVLKKNNEGALSFICVPLRPRSKGTVRLASRDPRVRPACDLGTLSDPTDYIPIRAAIRLSKAIANEMQSSGYAMRSLHGPPDGASEAELDSFIRSDVTTTFHYSSTCRMAPEAEGGVVNDELRVHGVEGLRIADASIFPWIPAAHLQAPVVMVAEHCADFILKARSE
jgi:choline dehydrogenase